MKRNSKHSIKVIVIIGVLFGLIGVVRLFRSQALTAPFITLEAEAGTLSGGSVAKSDDSTAAGTGYATVSVSSGSPTGCGQTGQGCTLAQIAAHNTASDCWVVYEAKYYDLTSYVNKHPGGKAVFDQAACGLDIKSFMTGAAGNAGEQHKHKAKAYTILESYVIGPVL